MHFFWTICLTFFLSQSLWSQIPRHFNEYNTFELSKDMCNGKVKQITQLESGQVTRIVEFNSSGKICFDYKGIIKDKKYAINNLFRINAYDYNKEGQIRKVYQLHSNKGHSITYTEWDTINRLKSIYISKSPKDIINRPINSNAYLEISEIHNYNQLIEYEEVQTIETSDSRILLSKAIINKEGNEVDVNMFEGGKEKGHVTMEYDDQNRLTHFSGNYGPNIKIRKVISYPQSFLKTEEFYTNSNGFQEELESNHITKTDRKGRDTFYYSKRRDGVIKVVKYIYNDLDLLIAEEHYICKNDNGSIIGPYHSQVKDHDIVFKYNSKGLVIKEIVQSYINPKKNEYKYKYKIVYF